MFLSRKCAILLTSRIFRKQVIKKVFYHHRVYEMEKQKSFSVFITTKIDEDAKKLLEETCEVTEWTKPPPIPKAELIKAVKDKNALFCTLNDKIDREILEAAGNKLKVVATMSVGYDHLDLPELKKRNIRIGYTPGVLTDATAELTLALLLATSRRLFDANEAARTGKWNAWEPYWMCGPGLQNSTIGIVGFGRIGQQIARLVKPFNVKEILFSNRSMKVLQAKLLHATQVEFDELLTKSDFVIVTCALTPETMNLFNKNTFAKMKKTAVFINTSRGPIVDQEALVNALKKNQIFAAGLDVTVPEPLPVNHELFKLKNCVILPHIGSAAIQTRLEMAKITVENILSALKNEPMSSELIVQCE